MAEGINPYSRPSQLRITDMRIAPLRGRLVGAAIVAGASQYPEDEP